ncbi:uncharacterized protein LOC110730620 [Chenopodium quinoa]|uniref:uncharacterized protein LOC110730620 n=1 Tax=Chenopodium quinoa TaxID=63459 RepID=UPI000B78DFB5|nr:uncharacterized protein LOC110730620 [Chenopodium quinoa]
MEDRVGVGSKGGWKRKERKGSGLLNDESELTLLLNESVKRGSSFFMTDDAKFCYVKKARSDVTNGGNFTQKEGIKFSLVSYSDHHICGDITDFGGRVWRFVGMYGWADKALKENTWTLMKDLYLDSPVPVVFKGDFNQILSSDEKSGGAPREQKEIDALRSVLDDCSLKDLGHIGEWETWERGTTPESIVRERLDKFIACMAWSSWFRNAKVKHLTKFKCDHVVIILDTEGDAEMRGKGASHLDMALKIKSVATHLTDWSKSTFDNLGRKIEDAEAALKEVENNRGALPNFAECTGLESLLDDLHEKNEAYYLRSRVAEIKDGDCNTKYFQHKASQRKSKNFILGLNDEGGTWRTGKKEIEEIILKFYGTLFSAGTIDDNLMQEVLDSVPALISEGMNTSLCHRFPKDEVFAALSQMSPCKAPGPDGFHAIFYQKFWQVVGDDITNFVNNIVSGRISPKEINCTNVALTPKVKDPTSITQFRPISLCNVLFKVASKAMANRLKPLL